MSLQDMLPRIGQPSTVRRVFGDHPMFGAVFTSMIAVRMEALYGVVPPTALAR